MALERLEMYRQKNIVVLHSAHPDQVGTVYYVNRYHIVYWNKSVDTDLAKTVVYLADGRTLDCLDSADDIGEFF